jgi:hypothetical protein
MADVALKLSKKKLVEGLSDLSFNEIKEIMESLIRKKLFTPPKARTLYNQASKITVGKKLSEAVAEESVKWARTRK